MQGPSKSGFHTTAHITYIHEAGIVDVPGRSLANLQSRTVGNAAQVDLQVCFHTPRNLRKFARISVIHPLLDCGINPLPFSSLNSH